MNQEHQNTECLILSGNRDTSLCRQTRKYILYLRLSHVLRVPLIAKEGETMEPSVSITRRFCPASDLAS